MIHDGSIRLCAKVQPHIFQMSNRQADRKSRRMFQDGLICISAKSEPCKSKISWGYGVPYDCVLILRISCSNKLSQMHGFNYFCDWNHKISF